MSKLPNRNSRGFTILELVIALALFLILSGSIIGGMAKLQANYRTAEMRTTMDQRLRATMELMAQEIGQAGLQASTIDNNSVDITSAAPYTTKNANIATGSQSVTLNSASGTFPYPGQWLQVPAGTTTGGQPCQQQDSIQVPNPGYTATFNATFGCLHPAGTPVYPMGVFPHGVLGDQSTATKLAIFGEFNGPGNGLFAVEYTCPSATGSLTRTEWSISGSTVSGGTSYNLMDNVTCSFSYPATSDQVTLFVPAGTVTYSMITQVGFTITASITANISGSSQTLTVTKSYSNIQPRNIIASDNIYTLACKSAGGPGICTPTLYAQYLNGELQPDPPALGTITW